MPRATPSTCRVLGGLAAALALLSPGGAARGQEAAPIASALAPRPGRAETVLRLVSDEWVRGELEELREGDLRLDGAKTGERTYDWKDVVELRTTERLRCTFDGWPTLVGRPRLEPGGRLSVTLDDGSTVTGLDPRKVVSMLPASQGEHPELSRWTGTISLSLAATYGNTRNVNGYGSVQLLRQSGDWWWRLSGELADSLADGEDTAKNRRGETSLEYDLTLRLFVVPAYLRAEYDKFQNVDLRLRAGSGVGYRIFREVDLHWQVEATALYSHVKYREVEPGADGTDRGSNLRLATVFETEVLDDDLRVGVTVESFLGLDDIRNTTHRAKVVLSWELVSDLTVDFTGTWERVERPQREEDGTLPERDDFQLSTGLGWRF